MTRHYSHSSCCERERFLKSLSRCDAGLPSTTGDETYARYCGRSMTEQKKVGARPGADISELTLARESRSEPVGTHPAEEFET